MQTYRTRVIPAKGRYLALVIRVNTDGTEQVDKQMRTSYATQQAAELAAFNAAVAYGSPAREMNRAVHAKMHLAIDFACTNTR